ncbi:MAG: nucleotide exchange factor GrpE [Woeseiaceae bacterium]|jgi:molecular chaperone GrpE|nr:nucleotide exchange factor GrpE [Woeseiaceae bacterium]
MNGQPDRPDIESDEENIDAEQEAAETPVDAEAIAEAETTPTLESLQAKADENWDRYLRAMAEADNIRKRATRDIEHAHKFALENFSKDLLAAKDSLEMGLAAADTADAESLLAGSEATLKLLAGSLERFGISEIDPEGEPFDPERHEAMTMQPSAEVEPGSVLTVIQKGYVLNGRLLRPARVIVASEPADG